MGCWSSRDHPSQILPNQNPLHQFLDTLSSNSLHETVVLKSTLYNYSFLREDQSWVLRRRNVLFTLNSLRLLDKEIQMQNYDGSDQVYANFDVDQHLEPFVIRPPQNTFPQNLLADIEGKSNSVYLQGLSDRIITTLQVGDSFPNQVYEFGANGKFTFILSWYYCSQSSRKTFHRFLQLYKHRWSKLIPDSMREFYGLCRGLSPEDKDQFEKETKKRKWDLFIHLYAEKKMGNDKGNFFNSWQLFNIPQEDNTVQQNELLDMLIIISPKGKVIKAERPNFLIEAREKKSVELQSENNSETSYQSNDLNMSQHSHSLQYEKSIEKDIKKAFLQQQSSERKSQSQQPEQEPQFQLSKMQVKLHSILSGFQGLNQEQFRDFKKFLASPELQAFLNSKQVGEQFQIELEKFIVYNILQTKNTDEINPQPYKKMATIYLIPTIYPACSYAKEHYIPQVIQYLHDNIPLKWKTPSMQSYTFQRQHTIMKSIMMEDLSSQLSQLGMGFLELFVQKDRRLEWRKQPSTIQPNCQQLIIQPSPGSVIVDEKNPKIERVENRWIQTSRTPVSLRFYSMITKVDNVPVGQIGYKNYDGMIQLSNEAFDARNNPDLASINFLGLDPIVFQLITDFYMSGLSTEVNLGSEYIPLPQCHRLNQIFTDNGKLLQIGSIKLISIQQQDPKSASEIPFVEGCPMLIYLIDWNESLENIQDLYRLIKVLIDMKGVQNQALSGLQQSEQDEKHLRLVILGCSSDTSIEQIRRGVKQIFTIESDEGLESLGQIEFWLPKENFYNGCVDYVYQGLLCKFFGLEVNCNNIVNKQLIPIGNLSFRGSLQSGEEQKFLERIQKAMMPDSLKIHIQVEDKLTTLFPNINPDDSQWLAVKQYYRKNKLQIDPLFEQLNKIAKEGSYFKLESTKYKLWDNHKHQFTDYSTKANLQFQLDDQSQLIMQEIIDAFEDIF